MKVIGLTGPSGAGKSCCAGFLETCGIPVIDADKIYHALIEKDSPCVRELVDVFGKEILNSNGGIDRKKLGSIVFSDTSRAKTERLNQITHKFVKKETLRLLEQFEKQGLSAVLIDAPLLFEADFHKLCDFCISVLAPQDLRLARIIARDNITAERANARLSAQKNDVYYKERSDYIVTNDSDLEGLTRQMKQIFEKEGLL